MYGHGRVVAYVVAMLLGSENPFEAPHQVSGSNNHADGNSGNDHDDNDDAVDGDAVNDDAEEYSHMH